MKILNWLKSGIGRRPNLMEEDMVVISTIKIEILISEERSPDSDEAWLEGNWEVNLDAVRDAVELTARLYAPAGTTVTVD